MTDDKKEKVLHTRVPSTLDDELRQQAAGLGISVSNLVRNILNNAVNLVEDVIVDGSNIGRASQGQPPIQGRTHETVQPVQVVGWQKLMLNMNAICADCNEILPKNTEAYIAVTTAGIDPNTVRCADCQEKQ